MGKVEHILFICPRGVMDNTSDSGSEAGGSIPSEGVEFCRIKSKQILGAPEILIYDLS